MRLWADVYDATGNKLGDGPVVTLTGARVTRALDGAGTVQVSAPLTDPRARTLLTNERRMRVFLEEDGRTRELGRGVIRKVRLSADGQALVASGPDSFDELRRVSVLLAREYGATSPGAIATALVGLVGGWSIDAEATSNIIGARYDGVSVLKALQLLAEQQGLHLRLGTAAQTLEFGAFGQATGPVLLRAPSASADLYANDDVALIEQLSLDQSTEAAYNWLLPLGAGEGVTQLTLQHATRSGPYTVQTMVGPNGDTLYYLADAGSIAEYGLMQKVGVFKIAPVTNSAADVVNAANALYDAAVAALARSKDRQDTYRTSVRKARVNVRPGDVVRLLYDDQVLVDGTPTTPLAVDRNVYVLKATEVVGVNGVSTELEISTVDRFARDAAQIIVGALEEIELRNVFVQPYPTRMGFYSHEAIDSTHSVIVPVTITDATLDLTRVLLRLQTKPLRSTAKGAASGGGATSGSGGATTPTSSTAFGSAVATGPQNGIGADHYHFYNNLASHSHTVSVPNHTHSVPSHTHPLEYGIYDDTNYPQNISLSINGVDVTAALGGPWGPSNAAVSVELEISSYLLNAVGGLRQQHELEWRCGSGQGTIRTEVEVVDVIQPIRV